MQRNGRMRRLVLAAAGVMLAGVVAAATDVDPPPPWAYPLNAAKKASAEPVDNALQHLPGSKAAFTTAQTRDVFNPPDWFPSEHPPMPEIVAHGRKPDVWACGYCHTPAGQGRPENAGLAGQRADYIVQQVMEMRAGRRRSAQPRMTAPALMLSVAQHVSTEDLRQAAAYFSRIPYTSRIRVVEKAVVPKTYVGGVSLLAASPAGGTEPIGERIIEIPEDLERTELRDPHSGFVAYVPPGSVKRGQKLVESGAGAAPCASCHGAGLKGTDEAPALAGRSPSYLVRQLYDFQHGTRTGPAAAPMQVEVAHLSPSDRIAVAAYLASLR